MNLRPLGYEPNFMPRINDLEGTKNMQNMQFHKVTHIGRAECPFFSPRFVGSDRVLELGIRGETRNDNAIDASLEDVAVRSRSCGGCDDLSRHILSYRSLDTLPVDKAVLC